MARSETSTILLLVAYSSTPALKAMILFCKLYKILQEILHMQCLLPCQQSQKHGNLHINMIDFSRYGALHVCVLSGQPVHINNHLCM